MPNDILHFCLCLSDGTRDFFGFFFAASQIFDAFTVDSSYGTQQHHTIKFCPHSCKANKLRSRLFLFSFTRTVNLTFSEIRIVTSSKGDYNRAMGEKLLLFSVLVTT